MTRKTQATLDISDPLNPPRVFVWCEETHRGQSTKSLLSVFEFKEQRDAEIYLENYNAAITDDLANGLMEK